LAEGGRTEEQSVKTDLYAVRAMLTGIHLLKTGEVQPDVAELAMLYDVPIVERMIDDKRQSEIGDPISYDRKELAETLNRLEGELENALQESTLPEKPGYEKLNDYLIEHRKGGL